MADARLTVANGARISLRASETPSASLKVGAEIYDIGGAEYDGEYVIRPQPHDEQVLPTAHKKLSRDVTVERIPYYETSNPSGGYTAIIGD